MDTPEPKILNPEQAREADALIRRPRNTPIRHTEVNDVKEYYKESYLPTPQRLDPDYTWVFTALLYSLVGLDKSIFELLHKDLGVNLNPQSVKSDGLIAEFEAVDTTRNPWFYTLQGLRKEDYSLFKDYVESFKFRRPTIEWNCVVAPATIHDPFTRIINPVSIGVILPSSLDGRIKIHIKPDMNILSLGVTFVKPHTV
jgi:hypothetical protein